jgi:hypothetical protein
MGQGSQVVKEWPSSMPHDADLAGAKQARQNEQHHDQCATAKLLSQTPGAGPSRLGQTPGGLLFPVWVLNIELILE